LYFVEIPFDDQLPTKFKALDKKNTKICTQSSITWFSWNNFLSMLTKKQSSFTIEDNNAEFSKFFFVYDENSCSFKLLSKFVNETFIISSLYMYFQVHFSMNSQSFHFNPMLKYYFIFFPPKLFFGGRTIAL